MDKNHALQTVLLNGCIKAKEATAAKASLPEASLNPVDITVRIRGMVSKGMATPESSAEQPASINAWSPQVMADILRRCKVPAAAIKRAAKAAITSMIADQHLDEASHQIIVQIEGVASAIAEKLPPYQQKIPGRAATVSVQITSIEAMPARLAAA